MYTNVIYIALNYRHTPHIKVAHTNCFASSLNIYVGKTLVPNFSAPSSHLSVDEKLYYNGGLFLNKSIDLTSINL